MTPVADRTRGKFAAQPSRIEKALAAPRSGKRGAVARAHSPLAPAAALRSFEQPNRARAAWQVVDTVVPYLATLTVMYLTIRHRLPYWITLALAVPASGFMVRLFILMHDCTHSSFLRSRRAQTALGRTLGVLVFTPFAEWRRSHLTHHATSGDLDRRGTGDIWTMTVDEYLAAPRATRIRYRLARHPLLMLLIGPFLVFFLGNRLPPRAASRESVMSVVYTDLAIAAMVAAAALTIGLRAYLTIQVPVLFLGGAWGIWLFYVQHQFEPSYWMRGEGWNPVLAALEGSSYYKLPRVLQWFSANIGLHHLHHLRPRIPNYNLQRCLDEMPGLPIPRPLTLSGSLRCARLALWDERTHAFLRFRDVAHRHSTS
jgi:omega-6 fatty acid desaturase (delta-12 desaturase)